MKIKKERSMAGTNFGRKKVKLGTTQSRQESLPTSNTDPTSSTRAFIDAHRLNTTVRRANEPASKARRSTSSIHARSTRLAPTFELAA